MMAVLVITILAAPVLFYPAEHLRAPDKLTTRYARGSLGRRAREKDDNQVVRRLRGEANRRENS